MSRIFPELQKYLMAGCLISKSVKFLPEDGSYGICLSEDFMPCLWNFHKFAIGQQSTDFLLSLIGYDAVLTGADYQDRGCDLFGKPGLGEKVCRFYTR